MLSNVLSHSKCSVMSLDDEVIAVHQLTAVFLAKSTQQELYLLESPGKLLKTPAWGQSYQNIQG